MPINDSTYQNRKESEEIDLAEAMKEMVAKGITPVINSKDIIEAYQIKFRGHVNPCFMCRKAVDQLKEFNGLKGWNIDQGVFVKPDALKYHLKACLQIAILP